MTIICQNCNRPTEKRTRGFQKYCRACSAKINWKRKKDWDKAHGREIHARRRETMVAQYDERTETMKAAGVELSVQRALIPWAPERPRLVKSVRLTIPFTWALSKNHAWAHSRNGFVHLRRESRDARESISASLKLEHHGFVQGKIWIDMLVQKPENRGDAVNFVDAICDAIKKGIGIDDRWYCIGVVDWQIVKRDPKIIVVIGQEYTQAHHLCRFCGGIKPRDAFGGKKNIGKECLACLRGAS